MLSINTASFALAPMTSVQRLQMPWRSAAPKMEAVDGVRNIDPETFKAPPPAEFCYGLPGALSPGAQDRPHDVRTFARWPQHARHSQLARLVCTYAPLLFCTSPHNVSALLRLSCDVSAARRSW